MIAYDFFRLLHPQAEEGRFQKPLWPHGPCKKLRLVIQDRCFVRLQMFLHCVKALALKNSRTTADLYMFIYTCLLMIIEGDPQAGVNDRRCFSSACIVLVFDFLILDIQWVEAMARNRRRKENKNWISRKKDWANDAKKEVRRNQHMQRNKDASGSRKAKQQSRRPKQCVQAGKFLFAGEQACKEQTGKGTNKQAKN